MKSFYLKKARKEVLATLFMLFGFLFSFGQTNPSPQSLPYSQNFGALLQSSTVYPTGIQGWVLGTSSTAAFRTTAPTGDSLLNANSTASTSSATVIHNYNSKIGFLNSGAQDNSIVTSVNTTGFISVQVGYNIMTIRNPYDGTTNTRTIENIIQYRVGTTGAFTNLTSSAYQTLTTPTQTTAVTTGQNILARSITLPPACDNQAVVQVRWASRDLAGAGSRPSIAIDDISISSTTPSIITSGTLAALSTVYGTASSNTSFTVVANNLSANLTITPPSGFQVSTNASSGFGSSLVLTQTGGSVASTTVYVRLSTTATGGTHSGNITLSDGTTSTTIATASSTVSPLGLTITGISIADKFFDGNATATISGTPTLVGVINSDDVTVSGGTASFNDAVVGNGKPVTVSGYTLSGTSSSNYSLTQPTGLTGNILSNGLSDQTITFNALSVVTYGDATFNLSATSDSNLPVSYMSSNTDVATINGNVVTIVGAGTTIITASQDGDLNYNPAVSVDQSLLVNTKELTISGATVNNKFYDGLTAAVLNGSLSGVINSDDVTLNLSGTFSDAFVGNNKTVTSTSTLSGTKATNYNLTQPTGLTASIFAVQCQSATGTMNWDFTGTGLGTANAINNLTNVSVSPIAGSNGNGSVTYVTTAAASTGYAGVSGTYNASMACFIGTLNTATSTYNEFTITPQPGYTFSLNGLSFGSRSTGSGPQLYSIRSSIDGYASNIASSSMPNNSTWALYTANSLTSVLNVATPVTIRIYGSNGTGTPSSGVSNWRLDDIILNVSSSPSSALSSATTVSACTNSTFNYTPTTSYTGATITWTRAAVAGISNAAVTTPQTGNISETLVNTTNAPIVVNYAFTVTTNTCYVTQNITVTVNPAPTVTASNVSGCSGTFIALSGTPAGGTFSVANPYTGLDTTYTHTFTDGNGCTATSNPATITNTSQPSWYLDADADGYYTGAAVVQCSSPGTGYTTTVIGGGDCADDNPAINPGATEVCYNNIDDNCDTTLSEGCAAVPVNMTPSYNGTTLPSLAIAVPAVAYTYPGASNIKYRYSITNTTTGVTSADIIQTSRYVTIPVALHSSPGVYTIKASAVINDEVVAYAGNTITVNAPVIPKVTLAAGSCGATLASLATTLTANAGLNATGYTFRIRLTSDSSPTPAYGYSSSSTRFVSANSFTGFPLSYGTSYKVSVQYTYTDPVTSSPADSGYGAECTVVTPSIPTTSLASPTCGSQVAALNANISATAASYATGYQFRIRVTSDNGPTPTYYYSLPNASRFSSLTAFQGITFAYNTNYSISVQYSIVNNSATVWSGYGAECIVKTPFFPTTALVPSQCGLPTATSLTQQLNITAYPGFPNYKVKLDEINGEDITNSQEIVVTYSYFRLNQFSIAQLGKNYNVSVAIKQGGVFGDYSTACDLFTAAAPRTIKMPFKAVAYPNPFANNFMLDVKTTSHSAVNLKVYDMVGRLIDQRDVNVSDLETTTIGDDYPSGVYNVIVSQGEDVKTARVVKR